MSMTPDLGRRKALLALAISSLFTARSSAQPASAPLDEVAAKVTPALGFQSRIRLGEAVVRLREQGAIDPAKLAALYEDRGGVPPELERMLASPSEEPILLTRASANNYYLPLLWPLGLANYMKANERSPINGPSLANLASTGGWTLGREPNGAAYFNKLRIVELTPEQEALVVRVAENTYRPCCNNSTFFQDCNHGSALLGLLELGAAQGLSETDLYREALGFNSFWFPQVYALTALYFKAVRTVDWEAIGPRVVMGFEYSALGPWMKNVKAELAKIPNLLPAGLQGAGCALGGGDSGKGAEVPQHSHRP